MPLKSINKSLNHKTSFRLFESLCLNIQIKFIEYLLFLFGVRIGSHMTNVACSQAELNLLVITVEFTL